MPRGKSKPQQTSHMSSTPGEARRSRKDDEWGGFVPVTLTEGDRAVFEAWWKEAPGEVRHFLDDDLSRGLKFTLSYDGGNQCYIASFTGRPDPLGERAFTCCLSARGGTFEEAIAVLVFKHNHLLQADWWPAINQPKASRFSFG